MIPVSVFSFTLKFLYLQTNREMFCSTPIGEANWEGSQTGFVCKQTKKNPKPCTNPPKNRWGGGWWGEEANKYL